MPRAEHAPAGFWPRAVAWLVDAAILGGIACLLASSWMRGDVDALGMAWRGLGSTLGEAVRSSVERGEDATTFMAAMLAADSPLCLKRFPVPEAKARWRSSSRRAPRHSALTSGLPW